MTEHVLHASCVDVSGRGVLVTGASASGKSALCLQLLALGAKLVADDRVKINMLDSDLVASAPATIKGLVEARCVGILRAETAVLTTLSLVVDMDKTEKDRLPACHWYEIGETRLPCLYRVDGPHFAASVFQMLRHGRHSPC